MLGAYPLLDEFVGTYLHQDWDLEYESDLEALDDFLRGEPGGEPLLGEIDRALAASEPDLYRRISAGCGYNFGDSAHAWLERLRTHLLERRESSNATEPSA